MEKSNKYKNQKSSYKGREEFGKDSAETSSICEGSTNKGAITAKAGIVDGRRKPTIVADVTLGGKTPRVSVVRLLDKPVEQLCGEVKAGTSADWPPLPPCAIRENAPAPSSDTEGSTGEGGGKRVKSSSGAAIPLPSHSLRLRRRRTPVRAVLSLSEEEEKVSTPAPSLLPAEVALTPSLPPTPRKRPRGRPPTTFEGVGIRERKEEERKKKEEVDLLRLEREVNTLLSRGILEAAKGQPGEDYAMSTPEAVRTLGSAELAAGIGECLGAITEIGKRSKRFKGALFGALDRAVASIQLATTSLVTRLRAGENEEDRLREMAGLRVELRALRSENDVLRADLEGMRRLAERAPPSSPRSFAEATGASRAPAPIPQGPREERQPSPLPQRRCRRRAVVELSSGSESEWRVSAPARSPSPPVFDDLLPEEALPPVRRPPIRGEVKIIEDFLPSALGPHETEYLRLTQKINRMLDQRAAIGQPSPLEGRHFSGHWDSPSVGGVSAPPVAACRAPKAAPPQGRGCQGRGAKCGPEGGE